jgi:hypothetical protein
VALFGQGAELEIDVREFFIEARGIRMTRKGLVAAMAASVGLDAERSTLYFDLVLASGGLRRVTNELNLAIIGVVRRDAGVRTEVVSGCEPSPA